MAGRSEARLAVSIWSDQDFLRMSRTAQWTYMFLLSQPDLTHLGVLPLRERRWVRNMPNVTVAQITQDLEELANARFLVIDWDACEVMIRSYLRHDKVYRQKQLLIPAMVSLGQIESESIRAAIVTELHRILQMDVLPDCIRVIERALEQLGSPVRASAPPTEETPGRQGDEHPEQEPEHHPARQGGGHSLGAQGSVTAVGTDSPNSYPLTPNPFPAAATLRSEPSGGVVEAEIVFDDSGEGELTLNLPVISNSAQVSRLKDAPENGRTILAAWIDYCASRKVKLTERVKGQYATRIKTALDEGFAPDLIKTALAQMLNEGNAGRPSYLDGQLVIVQNGPQRGPRRLTRAEESGLRMLHAPDTNADEVLKLMHEMANRRPA